jgi:chromosome segregation ATPase
VLTEGKDFSVEIADNIQVGYEIKFDSLKKEIADKDAVITDLKGKLDNLRRHEATMLEKIAEQNDAIADAKSKTEDLENKLSASRKDVAEKELALNQARSVSQSYKTQAEHKQADLNALNNTLRAAQKNNDVMREKLAKSDAVLANLKAVYSLVEVEPGVWRIPTGVDEARNTVLLDKLVSRLGLVLNDGEYFLPSEIGASGLMESKPGKKK